MFDDISILVSVMELSALFHKISPAHREQFLQYLEDEFACIDDEFSIIIDAILMHLYARISTKELEDRLNNIADNVDEEKLLMVLKAMIDYCQEYLYDVSFYEN